MIYLLERVTVLMEKKSPWGIKASDLLGYVWLQERKKEEKREETELRGQREREERQRGQGNVHRTLIIIQSV